MEKKIVKVEEVKPEKRSAFETAKKIGLGILKVAGALVLGLYGYLFLTRTK